MFNTHIKTETMVFQESEYTPTWGDLCKYSPELENLKVKAARVLADYGGRGFWERYETLKRNLQGLVGFYAHPDLPDFMHTETAYNIAFREIFGGLI